MMRSTNPFYTDHPSSFSSSPSRYQETGTDDDGPLQTYWNVMDHPTRPKRSRKIRTSSVSRSLILYLSLVALLGILLLNHRNLHQYVEPTKRQLTSTNRSATIRHNKNTHKNQRRQHEKHSSGRHQHQHGAHGSKQLGTKTIDNTLSLLREEFDTWVKHHNRNYGSKEETEKRWHIWKDNHHKTIQKNKLHGPCKVTQKHVFGSNHFKDLTSEEFRTQYLTGYGGPISRIPMENSTNTTATITTDLHPLSSTFNRHESVHHRYMKHIQNSTLFYHHSSSKSKHRIVASVNPPQYFSTNTSTTCKWYEVTCWLLSALGTTVTSIGKHREPKYDAESYPTAMDWRQLGAVTDIHTQGSCGACWAITAVETVESAYFISTGTLLDLSATEIIACDSTCQMCQGGWPQNAYEYVQKYKGIPLEKNLKYNGNLLLSMTECKYGSSSQMTQSVFASYQQSMCPTSSNNQNSGGRSNGNSNSASTNSSMHGTRYGSLKGYAYATDRCVCYTTGSGCDCNSQSEDLAIRNVASYGPATVCLDASTWQDYAGGIITSASGCSSKFLDMNHCVQVVGYAFSTGSSNNNNNNNGGGGKNQQQQNQKQEQQGNQHVTRVGYWIVRNQWSSYWGMNGYAYVAMSANTCGILNDMTQVLF